MRVAAVVREDDLGVGEAAVSKSTLVRCAYESYRVLFLIDLSPSSASVDAAGEVVLGRAASSIDTVLVCEPRAPERRG